MAAMAADRIREGSAARRSRSTEGAGESTRAGEAAAPAMPRSRIRGKTPPGPYSRPSSQAPVALRTSEETAE
eukprot:1939194-Alexandrium_andersonii.AAC.1